MKKVLVEKLRCVFCGSSKLKLLAELEDHYDIQRGELKCSTCNTSYTIVNGVAYLYLPLDNARALECDYYDVHISPAPDEPQNLDYGLGWSWQPALSHTDMLNFHFNRIFRHLDILVRGKQVLNIGCGPGREAEYLSCMQGASVVGLDIASNSVYAALQRGKRFGYSKVFDGVAGDMEILPFQDKSFDVVFITTALHHTTNWRLVLREMIRVARQGIVIDESTNALVICLAVWLGFSSNYEEDASGNKVIRFSKEELEFELKNLGVRECHIGRYWLNTSGRFRWFSIGKIRMRRLMRLFESEALLRVQSKFLDRIGNRLTVYAKL